MTILCTGTAAAATTYTDISGNWANEAISRLNRLGVFDGIYTDLFQPNEYVTREELLEFAARTFNLTTTQKQTLYSWLDHLALVDSEMVENRDRVTRGELVALVANLIGLTEQSIDFESWEPSFVDIPSDHPLFAVVEQINALEILPTYVMNHFEPERLATRAETAALLDAVINLKTVIGEVVEIHQPSQRVIVLTDDEQYQSVPIDSASLILRNGQLEQFKQIVVGDHIQALYNTGGTVALVSIESSDSHQGSLLSNLVNMLKGIQLPTNLKSLTTGLESLISKDTLGTIQQVLTPQQLAAIISGDWSNVNDNFRSDLFERLVELGLSPWEAEAVLSQDWQSLGDMGVDRVASLLSDYIGVSPELIYAAYNQEWGKLYEYAQVEIAQRLLTALM